jgi:hypothetical protein
MLKYNLFPICNRKDYLLVTEISIVLGDVSQHIYDFHKFLINNKIISGSKLNIFRGFIVFENYVDSFSSELTNRLYELLKDSIKQDI